MAVFSALAVGRRAMGFLTGHVILRDYYKTDAYSLLVLAHTNKQTLSDSVIRTKL